MFNKEKFNEALSMYKEQFVSFEWEKENYKWIAIKCFQDNWNIEADNFSEMLGASLAKTYNLLASVNNYPKQTIVAMAEKDPDKVRNLFTKLFDEGEDVVKRIISFKDDVTQLFQELNLSGQHYQYENVISTYLWLKYPDKYYIYKYGEVRNVAEKIESSYSFKKGKYVDNLRNFYMMYDEICQELGKDQKLIDIFRSQLNDDCYPDPKLKTLTTDFGFYISRYYSTEETTDPKDIPYWPDPKDYDPKLSKEDWKTYIDEVESHHHGCMGMLKGLLEMGGEASCKALSEKYGGDSSAYVGFAVNIGKRAKKYFDLPACMDGDVERYFPVPFLGRAVDGLYYYALRQELKAALEEMDLSGFSAYYDSGVAVDEESDKQYWWLNASPSIWSFSRLAVGKEQNYSLYNDNGNKRRIFQNFLDVKEGDFVIGYEANPVKQIVALGKISHESDGESIGFEKTEGLSTPIDFSQIKEVPELANMQFLTNPNGSLFKLTENEYEILMDIIRENNPVVIEDTPDLYTEEDFLNEVFIDEARYKSLVELLRNKKNIILQGAPGVGKTFIAKRLAYSMMGEKDESRIGFVQFHQNYSYEDFVLGYRPFGDSFKLEKGIFYDFCSKAMNKPEKEFFFIIDEINRGNLSKIFGELLMLIENDHREDEITLAYNGMPFSVPKNIYIIGMMNTADRSLAMIDYALRRRFSFFEMEPGFDSDGFKKYLKGFNDDTFNELIERIKELNEEIRKDKTLGKGFCIGHSYFCGRKEYSEEWLRSVVDYDIIPTLEEYWFDDDGKKIDHWKNILHDVFR